MKKIISIILCLLIMPMAFAIITPYGTIHDDPICPGDANGGGSVNDRDVQLIADYAVGHALPIDLPNADMNDDNQITVTDALILSQQLVDNSGWSCYQTINRVSDIQRVNLLEPQENVNVRNNVIQQYPEYKQCKLHSEGEVCVVQMQHCATNEKAQYWQNENMLKGHIVSASYLDKNGFMCQVDLGNGVIQSWPVRTASDWWCGEVRFEQCQEDRVRPTYPTQTNILVTEEIEETLEYDPVYEGEYVTVTPEQLLANPEKYDGKNIETKGVYTTGFERSNFEKTIWINYASDAIIKNKPVPSNAELEDHGVYLKGTFETGSNGYGHLNWARHQIVVDYMQYVGTSTTPEEQVVTYNPLCSGDANGDGKVTDADPQTIAEVSVGLGTFSLSSMHFVDMNNDDRISIVDSLVLAQMIERGEIGVYCPIATDILDDNGVIIDSDGNVNYNCDGGCFVQNTCVKPGTRLLMDTIPLYCNQEGVLVRQQPVGQDCNANANCLSNACISGVCENVENVQAVSNAPQKTNNAGFFEKVGNFFKNLFGG